MLQVRYPILLLLVLAFASCTKERKYTTGIISAAFSNADNTGRVPVETGADSIAAKVYAIKLSFGAVITNNDGGSDIKGETQYRITNPISSASIYSLTDFDTAHPAGSSLADCFSVLNDTVAYQLKAVSGYNLSPRFDFAGKKSDQDTFHNSTYLVLTQNSPFTGPKTFVISLTLTDSTHYTDTLHINLR